MRYIYEVKGFNKSPNEMEGEAESKAENAFMLMFTHFQREDGSYYIVVNPFCSDPDYHILTENHPVYEELSEAFDYMETEIEKEMVAEHAFDTMDNNTSGIIH